MQHQCCEVAEKNAQWCGFDGSLEAEGRKGVGVCGDVLAVLRDPKGFGLEGTFDLVSATPPYEEVSGLCGSCEKGG